MAGTIELFTGDVSDVEAYVFARYVHPSQGDPIAVEGIELRGTLRGPYCESARTLPAEVHFRGLGPKHPGLVNAVVPDPCTWSPELPHLYQADVVARRDGKIIAEYHGMIGLRQTRDKA